MRTSLIISLFLLFINQSAKAQNANLALLEGFIGNWEHSAEQIRPDGSRNTEEGSMEASWFLDGTYLKVEAALSGDDYTRYYTQYIGYDRSTKTYKSTYLYSGTIQKVFEEGEYDDEKGELSIQGVNPFSSERENGINISSTFKIEKNKIVLEVIELRPGGIWELGYRAVFTRS